MKKLAIITSHPIQYYAPVFKLMAERQQLNLKVFYTLGKEATNSTDRGFGKKTNWDIDLLDGYDLEWVNNTSHNPGSHHFNGIINPELTKQIDSFAPDAILIFGWSYNSHLKALKYYHGKVPVIFRGDSTLLDGDTGLKQALRWAALKWIYNKIDYALYVGTNNKAYFEKYGLKTNQLRYAPHAVDNGRFTADRNDEATALRVSLNLEPSDILILFSGKFIEKKDPLILIEAIRALNRPDIHLLLTGDGKLHADIVTAIEDNPNIHLLPFQNQSQMPVVYQACDLFCMPSQGPGETWGLAVNEAMACGKAVLVSNKCGCAVDVVKPGVNGYVFQANNLADLIESLQLLCVNRESLASFGAASAEIIKDFSFLAIATAIETLVNET